MTSDCEESFDPPAPEKAAPSDECRHTTSHLTDRRLSNGSHAIYRQCKTCGATVGTAIARSKLTVEQIAALSPFDENLATAYHECRRVARVEAQESESQKAHIESQQEYQEYLKTPQWYEKRNAVMKRDNYVCQGCLRRRATQVHHLTYAHKYNELLFELVAICDHCHAQAHPEHR